MEVFHSPKAGYKWSTSDVQVEYKYDPILSTVSQQISLSQKYSGAFASGLLESGFRPGDALATWLPKDSAEAVGSFVYELHMDIFLNIHSVEHFSACCAVCCCKNWAPVGRH
jgi:hypothetical protein